MASNCCGLVPVCHDVRHLGGFLLGVEDMKEGGGIAQVLVGLLVLGLQDFENPQVALDAVDASFGEQIDDAWLLVWP